MKQKILTRLKSTQKPVIINGAGMVGETVLGFCRDNGIAVAGFCDGSLKVEGTDFHGFKVMHTQRLKDHYPDALILVTAAAIKDVVDMLREEGFEDWVAAGPLLEDLDVGQNSPALDFHKFSVETCIICHAGYLNPERAFLRSIDLIITERCSLKCKDCSNLMQYYENPKNVALDLLFQSVDALCLALDEIMELRVIGGDAFMNKQWPLVVEKLLGEPKIKRVVIYTNGAIVPKVDHAPLLKHPKVLTIATDYGALSSNMDKLIHYFVEHGIAHRILQVDSWLDCASLEKHERSKEDNAKVYQDCCAKNMLSLSDGKLFRCPFAANADRLSAVPEFNGDYVDVLAAVSSPAGVAGAGRKIMDYVLNKGALEVCDYCNGRPLSGVEVKPAVQTEEPLSFRKFPRIQPIHQYEK
ncbi:MAG: radical SAM protein [Sulfuricellaceae bacterium]|nr:radical SAM protein [Sulfuricellaceae bacterium]